MAITPENMTIHMLIGHISRISKDEANKKSDALSQLLFECARMGNILDCDLEQELFVKNDEFCKEICKNV